MKAINPYRLFVGSFIPNWLLRCQDLSHGAKLAYARLCQYADKESGEAWPGQDVWAEEIGVSARTLRRYIEELESSKLIEVVQRGQSETNFYRFLAHPLMSGQERSKVSSPDRSEVTTQDRSKVSGPLLIESREENQRRESSEAVQSLPFQTKEFSDAWKDWLKYRRELKKPLTPSTIKSQLKGLESLTESDAIAAIRLSIMKGWQGLVFAGSSQPTARAGVGVAGCPDRKLMTREDIDRAAAELK